jgi:hypothetical protein
MEISDLQSKEFRRGDFMEDIGEIGDGFVALSEREERESLF